ncbi:TetR/AcrR family transcriptional regulator [Paenibacillus polysaccharolyticus]|uniref:TetR/AcrR family transcriptional regulator n=1 Tax=Paenibacillus cucumis (ex Kampfer et al. 2016) TaxID=1776858 RepID=A0ABS7KGJ7_9BACL|nr:MULTISPECIES: TetR/AcrR family transcriptional regulator [Paenibacillus]MBY0203265.1 TetR/AcrR family transcriptional regulator [Paenibacillus cucumis (ex Kampfer et al. 2016)]MCP1133787.1 TetR/AcrR family transcriptional regulator [Paenibacillus polysaccharolyticus]
MPYPKGHKLKVRNHIITSAAKAFRTHGVRNISLPHIMKGAGLTHGGFYSHFENKDQLVKETCHFAISDTMEMLQKVADKNKNEDQSAIEAVIDFYLGSLHRDQTEVGCILPALSGEISQLSEEIRQAYTRELQRFITFITELAEIDTSAGYALVSSMVGTVALARAVSDSKFSDDLLQAGRTQAKQTVNAGSK